MSFGPGQWDTQVEGYGDASAWGGPGNSVDMMQHLGSTVQQTRSSKVSEDTYMFIIIMAALGSLWLLGGVFRSARLG